MKLREMRKKLGMSLTDLSEALEIPRETISRWENGRLAMGHPQLLKLALEHLRCKKREKRNAGR